MNFKKGMRFAMVIWFRFANGYMVIEKF